MDIFSISCTTCQQRLKVHDESAIGEIQICPKCGSMVLVEPPPGWQPGSGQATASVEPPPVSPPAPYDEELDKETVVDPFPASDFADLPIRSEPMKPPVEAQPASPPYPSPSVADLDAKETADLEELRGTQASAEDPHAPEAPEGRSPDDKPSKPDEEPPEVAATQSAPILPTDDWTSPAARQRKQMLLIVGAAVAGVALAIGLLGFFASRAARHNMAENGGEVDTPPKDPAADTTPADPQTQDGASIASVQDQQPDDVDDGSLADGAPADPQPDTPPTDEPLLTDDSTAAKPGPKSPADTGDQPDELQPNETPAEARPPEEPSEDPGTAPTEMPPNEAAGATDEEATNDALDAAVLAAIDAFAPFIEMEQAPAEPATDSTQTSPPELEPLVIVEEPSVPRPQPRTVDVPARMTDKIARVQMPGLPLNRFVRFLSDFSTIPITVDPDALALVKIPPQHEVSVQGDDLDTQRLLNAVLQPIGLSYIAVDSQLLLTRPAQSDDQLREIQHPADDLAADAEQAQALADQIIDIIEPDSWATYGGPGTIRAELPNLAIRQRDTILFRAIVFCERLRAARGLPPRSNFDPALFTLTPRFQRADQKLNQTLTLNFIQPVRLERILDAMTQETGVAILVDWIALGGQGWNPDAETTLSVLNEPLSMAMDKLVRPMGLVYRVVGESTLQITTADALLARLDIEFYPLQPVSANAKTDQQILDSLIKQFGEQTISDVRGTLAIDPNSRHVIAAMPQPYQRRLAEWLKSRPAVQPAGN